MSRRLRSVLLVVFGVTILLQLVTVYWPSPPQSLAPLFGWDKVVHALAFGVPVLVGLAARLRLPAVVGASVVHAPVSEWLQSDVLPHRSGDWTDAVADLVGIALAVLVWALVVRTGRGRARADLC